MVTKALYQKLAGDSTLVGYLSTYKTQPAIFTVDPAPENAEFPYLVLAGDSAGQAFDTKLTRGQTVWRDIRIYAKQSGSAEEIEKIANRVRKVLHRTILSDSAIRSIVIDCTSPQAADDDRAYGRMITAKITFLEV